MAGMFATTPPAHRFLAAQPWFAAQDASLRQALQDGVHTLRGAKGEAVLEAGAEVGGWYAVLSGLVMLHSPEARGRQSAFLGVPDGEWFGEGSAMKAEPRRYRVVALRETQLMCLPLPLFQRLRETSLAFNQCLAAHLNMRLGQAMAIIEAGRMRSPEHRVALYLSPLFWRSTRRIHLTQEELGHLAGLSRQTVNRVLRQLEALRIVSLDFGRVAIVDDAALAAYISDTADA
ncbi:Crp/Fnr family transcriptional regulator [Acidovorax sp. SDU_ACID1]|uniref:Crp/Fnr family transcriptional regulator n=1 Tax=Acidovorax sp. SDU_ACID1 TaxID=3136632 RepID=UPI0038732B94